MKYGAVILLFLFFILCLSAVRYADDYSQRYQKCVIRDDGEAISQSHPPKISVKPCPVIYHHRRDYIINVLNPKDMSEFAPVTEPTSKHLKP